MSSSDRVKYYQFQDSINGITSLVAGHSLFAIFFLIDPLPAIEFSPRVTLNLAIALTTIFLLKTYDWRSTKSNLLLIFTYILSLVVELSIIGLPSSGSSLETQHIYLTNKGGLTDIIIGIGPLVYAGLRLFFVLPLILLWNSSKQLKGL